MSTQIDSQQAAALLKISEQRVRTLCRDKILSAQKFRQSWVLDKNSVEHYGLQHSQLVIENHPNYKSQPLD